MHILKHFAILFYGGKYIVAKLVTRGFYKEVLVPWTRWDLDSYDYSHDVYLWCKVIKLSGEVKIFTANDMRRGCIVLLGTLSCWHHVNHLVKQNTTVTNCFKIMQETKVFRIYIWQDYLSYKKYLSQADDWTLHATGLLKNFRTFLCAPVWDKAQCLGGVVMTIWRQLDKTVNTNSK